MYGHPDQVVLQSTLSLMSAESNGPVVLPHHPINCIGELAYDGETFSCPHAKVVDDARTKSAVRHSIAMLILQIADQTL